LSVTSFGTFKAGGKWRVIRSLVFNEALGVAILVFSIFGVIIKHLYHLIEFIILFSF
jgi:hypothetical protein